MSLFAIDGRALHAWRRDSVVRRGIARGTSPALTRALRRRPRVPGCGRP